MRKRMKQFLLALAALTFAVTAAPAAAQERIFEYVLPPVQCYEIGFWAWDGLQYVWVPERTVCEY